MRRESPEYLQPETAHIPTGEVMEITGEVSALIPFFEDLSSTELRDKLANLELERKSLQDELYMRGSTPLAEQNWGLGHELKLENLSTEDNITLKLDAIRTKVQAIEQILKKR